MTEPTDRERVAKALYSASATGSCTPWEAFPIGGDTRCRWLAIADRAISLGAKPPVDPVETVAKEVGAMVDNWCVDAQIGTDESVWKLGDRIVRHVLDRAKELGL